MSHVVFETERLHARRLEPGDERPMLEVYGDAEAMRWVGDGVPLTAAQCDRWLAVTAENYRLRGYGMFALVERASGKVVGFCGLVHPGGQAEAEVKYAFARAFWGRGLATEAVRAVLDHGSSVHGAKEIIATVAPDNAASQRVLLKAGMQQVARRSNPDGTHTLCFSWHPWHPWHPWLPRAAPGRERSDRPVSRAAMNEEDGATPTFEESFAAAERAAFRFLVDDHGFLLAERQVARDSAQRGVIGRVRYRSSGLSEGAARAVELTIAPLRLALDLHVSKANCGPYAIEELHALDGQGPFPNRQHGLYDAMHNPEELAAEFGRLAGVLRACGARFFDDDAYLWEDLEGQRERKAADEEIRRTLALSQELFRARDWARVVELLSPIEFRLGTRASARLAYAKRRASER